MPDLSGKSIKGYELQARLGEGAYGAVYRATQPQIKREVAIKIILPEFANRPDFIRRFEAEAQLVAQLEHLHIVPLYDYWREPGGAYLVMRLMKGGSLEESLRESGPWEPTNAARLVDQIASALEAAHKQGVVHRDLKPANILLDEDGNAYLSDFGIAKEIGADASATQTGVILGTPAYITPEQVQSQPVTAQTDIYALGVVLYELLVGGHPFPDTPTGELVVKHLNEPLPYVRESKFDLPAALDGVIQRATAKDPENRYPDALLLAADLRSALDMEAEAPEVPEAELTNPYKGLRAFQEADADDFFGRDALIGQLLARLVESGEGGRFLAVVGPSGSGKSSAVKAGLVPALRKGALPGSDEWFITEMMPGTHPLEELERALTGIAVNADLNLSEELSKESYGLLRAAWMALPGQESELLLVIDQFEELFILVEDESEREHFLKLLHTAVTDKESIVRVVVTLRADFYDRPLIYPEFSELMQTRTEVVIPLTAAELEQAVLAPAERVGAVLEKGLVGAISADVAEQPGALPLLQYALTELFERREGRMLTGETYLAIGGVLGVLGRRAEEVYGGLAGDGKDSARQLFMRLVTLGEGTEDTRRRVLRTEIEGLISEQETETSGQNSVFSNQQLTISNVIEEFGAARLLSFDRDPVTREPTVEVAHEALLQEWRRLREWLDESRADIRMQRVLGNAASEWLDSGQEVSFLMRGSRLDQFEGWVAGTDLALTTDEQAFMEASLAERREREAAEAERQAREAAMERRSRNFLRGLVVVLAVAAVVAVVLSVFALDQQGIAQDKAKEAEQNAATATIAQGQAQIEAATAQAEAFARATQQKIAEDKEQARATQQALAEEARQEALVQASIGLAGQAMNELNGRQPERAVPLALEAVENYPYTWQARRALGMTVLNHKLDLTFQHGGIVWFSDLSNDGKRLLTSSGEGTLRIWDTDHGEELIAIPDLIDFVATWSPDESQMLIIADDNEEGYWFELRDGSSGELLHSQEVDSECHRGYEYNPWSSDGARFVTAHNDGSARVWEASSGEEILRLSGHEERVIAEWSPAGDLILTNGGNDGLITMWDAVRGVPIYTLPVPTGGSSFRNWSPNGDRFIVRDFGQVHIYESASGNELLTLEIPGVMTDYAKFSPDGLQIITSSTEDGTARLWDAGTGRLLSLISGMGQAQGIVWSPFGNLAAVGGQDGLVRIWDTASGNVREELHFPSDTTNIHWSPVEDKIIVYGSSSKIMIYRLNQALLTIPGVPGGAGVSDWSPDGQYFGNTFLDGNIHIWDAETWEEVFTLSSGDWFGGLAWSPSGDRIMTWNFEGPLRVWDAASGELMVESPYSEETMFDAKWSPDGHQIVGTSFTEEGKVAVWDAATLEEISSFYVRAWAAVASWSPDGKRIATTGDGGEATIRDAITGEVQLQLFPDNYSEVVEGIVWSKDGERVIVFSVGTGYLFNATTGEELMQYSINIERVFNILWSVDEDLIYAAGPDGTVRVFEVATGVELLVYEVGGWTDAALSPDGTHILITSGGDGTGYLYPTWNTTEDLIAHVKECCLVYELTPEEREQFGLPER